MAVAVHTGQGNVGRIKIPNSGGAGLTGQPPATGGNAGFKTAPAAPRRTLTTTKPPVAKPSSGGGGGLNPYTSTFGLNTGDKTPFNALGGPTTQGQFNQEVLNAARQQFEPQLQQFAGQTSAENTANTARVGDIGSIYNQYQKQAQDAFNQVQQALQGMILRNTQGDTNAQANLQAALQSSQGGQNSLAQMMGMSGPGAGQTLPYMGAASNAAQATQQQMSGLGQGTIGLEGENLANVGNERATELNTESLRHQGALQGISSQQQALEQQVPGIIEQVRQQMLQNLQNAEGLQFQQNLAAQQFGLASNQQQFNQNLQTQQFKETQLNDASNRASQAATIKQNAQALANQQAATQAAAQAALAKAQGAAQDNAIKYLSSWLAPTKQELTNKKITNPDGSTQTVQALGNPNAWHRDVQGALNTLTTVYGLSHQEALSIMAAVGGSTYINGQGGMTVAEWANTYDQRLRQQQQARQSVGKGLQGGKKSKGFKLPTL